MKKAIFFLFILVCAAVPAFTQTNEITYQGKLTDGANPANGNYDMQFQLYALVAGNQTAVGTPVERLGVPVSNGVFTVMLDFSHVSGSFTGLDRFLGISVRPAGSGAAYTALTPTQKFTSTPYAIRSQNSQNASTATNSTQLGGVAASQYVITSDSRMSDARQPLPGSGDYIQNSTNPQATSNFNITGDGTAGGTLRGNVVSATTGFDIGSTRVLSVRGTNNTMVGENAGGSVLSPGSNNTMVGFAAGDVTSGGFNSFVGSSAGAANTTGVANSFFGALAGNANTTGLQNSFFGRGAGAANTTADGNSFFGAYSGNVNTAADNSFFGSMTGLANTTGYSNSFFGVDAGKANTTGFSNSFFGARAGTATTTGDLNSFFGTNSGQSNTTGIGNSFFGANTGTATTTGSNNSFFGRSAGASNTNGTGNAFFGALAGQLNSTGINNSFFGANAGDSTTAGNSNSFFGKSAGAANMGGNSNAFFGFAAGSSATQTSSNAFFGSSAGSFTTSGSYNSFVGGTAGYQNSTGENNSFFGFESGRLNSTGSGNTFIGVRAGEANVTGINNTIIGYGASLGSSGLNYATAIGFGATATSSGTVVLGRPADQVRIPGTVRVAGQTYFDGPVQILTGNLGDLVLDARGAIAGFHPGGGNGSDLCEINPSTPSYPYGTIARCSSSIRYKENVSNFTRGMDLLRKLRPVTYQWKASGALDVGFIAEEVAEADPLFAVYKDGQIESVKYKQLTTVLVNAAMEQQTEIDELKTQIEKQKAMIESLKQLVCAQNPEAAVCKEEEKK